MDRQLLRSRPLRPAARLAAGAALGIVAALAGGCLFDDPVEQDPSLFEDASFDTLPASESYRVTRGHILESFGAFNCSKCPGAEEKLSRYLHPAVDPSVYNPNLVIVNYHVIFSGVTGTWVTPATQARYEQFGFVSLPQVKMNGANAPYGIRETDVPHLQGEYDTLIRRLDRLDSLSWIDLRVDTAGYDSAAGRMTVAVTLLNRATDARGGVSVRVLAVKNRPTTIQGSHPWEVIVAETSDADSSGAQMRLPGMAGLRAKTWVAAMDIPAESTRTPPTSSPENPADYAIVAFVRDAGGIVLNVASRNYAPQAP